jgi:hypothetical protein
MFSRRVFRLVFPVVVSLLLLPAPSTAGVTDKASEFDHVEADIPDEVAAGEEFEVVVSFVGHSGNLLSERWKPSTTFSLAISRPGSVLPSVLTPESFRPIFRFLVSSQRTGPLDLALMDRKGLVLGEWSLNVTPGSPAGFVVQLPGKAEAGEKVALSFKAVDLFGNVATNYEPDYDTLTVVGAAVSVADNYENTGEGNFMIPVIFRSAGNYSVNLKDRRKGLSGTSNEILVTPSPLTSFEIMDESYEVTAGDPLTVKIKALDRYNNPVMDYSERYGGVKMFSGTAGFTPDILPSSSFKEGTLTVQFNTRKAGVHDIRIKEVDGSITGRFTVQVKPAEASVIKVRTQDPIRAGGSFNITLEAEDEFGNRVERLPEGCVVRIESSGGGVLKPETVHGSVFKGGIADIFVTSETAEPFEIKSFIEKMGTSAASLGDDGDDRELKRRAERAREEAIRAKRMASLNQKRALVKQVALAEPVSDPMTGSEGAQIRPETVDSTGSSGTKPYPVRSVKKLRPGVLDGVTVKETDNIGIVSLSTNGAVEYDVYTSAKFSRKWINVVLPGIIQDLPDHLSGGEKIIGEIYVEGQQKGKGVKISVEILPLRIGYELFQQGDYLILKVARQ